MPEVLPEAERLFAVAPERFVEERNALAKTLREEGRDEDATTVDALRKPTAVVFAVNRAARDRPRPARAAAEAAQRVKATQLGGDPDEFQQALRELDDALGLLADVAVAQLSPPGKKGANDAMRRRVRVLLRSAAADDDAREALARGALTEELDAPGFSPFAGMTAPAKPKRPAKKGPTRAEQREAEKQARVEALRDELGAAEEQLEAATKAARNAERARSRAEAKVESLRKKLAKEE